MKRVFLAALVGLMLSPVLADGMSRREGRWSNILKLRCAVLPVVGRGRTMVAIRDYDGNERPDVVVCIVRVEPRDETLSCVARVVAELTSHAVWRYDKLVVTMYGFNESKELEYISLESCHRCGNKPSKEEQRKCFEEVWKQ